MKKKEWKNLKLLDLTKFTVVLKQTKISTRILSIKCGTHSIWLVV